MLGFRVLPALGVLDVGQKLPSLVEVLVLG